MPIPVVKQLQALDIDMIPAVVCSSKFASLALKFTQQLPPKAIEIRWFLSAYFLDGYGEDARGKNGLGLLLLHQVLVFWYFERKSESIKFLLLVVRHMTTENLMEI
ncbi:hypothetical protein Pfo_018533 [Paulownia fortunei]|nr:hypothetical protein Pfo_018533 [Paulownia fortunei]